MRRPEQERLEDLPTELLHLMYEQFWKTVIRGHGVGSWDRACNLYWSMVGDMEI